MPTLQRAKSTLPTTGYYVEVDCIDPNTLREEFASRGDKIWATELPDEGHGVPVVRLRANSRKVLEAFLERHGYEGSVIVDARHRQHLYGER